MLIVILFYADIGIDDSKQSLEICNDTGEQNNPVPFAILNTALCRTLAGGGRGAGVTGPGG